MGCARKVKNLAMWQPYILDRMKGEGTFCRRGLRVPGSGTRSSPPSTELHATCDTEPRITNRREPSRDTLRSEALSAAEALCKKGKNERSVCSVSTEKKLKSKKE